MGFGSILCVGDGLSICCSHISIVQEGFYENHCVCF